MHVSHEVMEEFDGHQMILTLYDDAGEIMGFIAVHKGTNDHPAFGATRMLPYSHTEAAMKDVLRLSHMMSYKSALAGLRYGGAKAVLFDRKRVDEKKSLITTYAERINYLRGSFITGADMGISPDDIQLMRKTSDYIVGVSIDPVAYTAQGVLAGIQACVSEVFGDESLKGRSFAIQGLGKIGTALLQVLYHDAQQIFVCDIDAARVQKVKGEFPNIIVVSPEEIFMQKADVYCPAAMGGIFTSENVANLQCKIIAGGANNQLLTDEVGDLLHQKGILYAPDYVINAGGLIAVVEEYEHPEVDPIVLHEKVSHIKVTMQSIIKESKNSNKPTKKVADERAEKIFETYDS